MRVTATRVNRLAFSALVLLGISVSALRAEAQVVPGQYIVVLNDNVANPAAVARGLAAQHGVRLGHVYEHALKGFSFTGPAAAAQALGRNPLVTSVEADQVVQAFCHQDDPQVVPTGIRRTFAAGFDADGNPIGGNPNITIDGIDNWRIDVDIAIIDTGIDLTHFDLNVVASTDCTKRRGGCKDGQGNDDNGHGSHVAGSAAAIDNENGVVGVAPGARLHAVKVLGRDGSGTISGVVAGIDWVTARAGIIEVANMSLGCACSSGAMDQAITNSVAEGVVYAVAAGNSDKDASTFSPANHVDVITVSALADFNGQPGGGAPATCRSDQDDTLANFSNWGSLIDVTAPGVCIYSLWKDGMCATISGTSMASPHVAGAAALLASGANDPTSKADVDAIIQTIRDEGNFNWTDDSGDGPQEPLLDVGDWMVFDPATVAGSSPPGCDLDTDCAPGAICCGGTCTVAECSADGDCNDANVCTYDLCSNSGTCSAFCVNTLTNDPSCACLGVGESCVNDADCCLNQCKGGGKKGKTCKE